MIEEKGGIIVGVLGQWASGKTEAARTLIDHLGGDEAVTFIADRELLTSQVLNYVLDDPELVVGLEPDGCRRYAGRHACFWLKPGEEVGAVDLSTIRWMLDDRLLPPWHHKARVALGSEICRHAAERKPIVIEAAYGPHGQIPGCDRLKLTISDLFCRLEEAGVKAGQVKWIIVEASYEKRAQRNRKRPGKVPDDRFECFAADGGGLAPEHQHLLEERGAIIRRVNNEHDDVERFRADIIAAFEAIYSDLSPSALIGGQRQQRQ